jgi:uncharacterized membrane protein YfcA
MPFTLTHYLLVSAILLASSVLHGAIGFAAGLFGIPLMMLTGLSLPDAIIITLVASTVQNGMAAWQLRREIDYAKTWRPMLIRLVTLPLGVWTLHAIGSTNKDLAAQIVGVVVLAIVFMQSALRIQPRPHLHPAWEWAAFGIGGYLLGLCAMGGPAMVLWVMAHDWPMNRARAFLYFLFVTGLPLQVFFLWLFFRGEIFEPMWLGLATLPAVFVGIYTGLWIGKRIPDQVLRPLAWGVLVLIALSAIASPWLRAREAGDREQETGDRQLR